MDADIQGSLNQIDKSYRAFEYKGKPMTKRQVKAVLEYGKSQGFELVSQIKEEEVDNILNSLKAH